ncbi:hypothetical protein F2Q69_00028527 [Brassica cretica]|uniref:Uncharacterized protein n=1 Tax=Brassica cretica TaxID=69181 RepID=A0A8S9S2W3_BRACR|nr:hypothetical protein F2Q69_00028527 [Brassica cretica]
MQHNKRIYITTNDSDREGKTLSFYYRERYAEASRRSRGRRNRRRERQRRGFIDEIEREREAESSRRARETRIRRPEREREAAIPPIETPTDAVDKEISSWRRDHRFAYDFASREREKKKRLREREMVHNDMCPVKPRF